MEWENDSQKQAYMGAPKAHPYMPDTLKKGPISVLEESGPISEVENFSENYL